MRIHDLSATTGATDTDDLDPPITTATSVASTNALDADVAHVRFQVVAEDVGTIFPFENALFGVRYDELYQITGTEIIPTHQLDKGLPRNRFERTDPITGMTGRFPESAWLAVSTEENHGGGEIYRYVGDHWAPVTKTKHRNAYVNGLEFSNGRGFVFQIEDLFAPSRYEWYVVPNISATTKLDLARARLPTRIKGEGLVHVFPTGHIFHGGYDDEAQQGVIELFIPGQRTRTSYTIPMSIHAFAAHSPQDAYVAGAISSNEPGLAHFDGNKWTVIEAPKTPHYLTSIAINRDGSLWVTSQNKALWRRDQGTMQWRRVSPMYNGASSTFSAPRVFTTEDGEMYLYDMENLHSVLLVHGGTERHRVPPPFQSIRENCSTPFWVISRLYATYQRGGGSIEEAQSMLHDDPDGKHLKVVRVVDGNFPYTGVALPNVDIGLKLIELFRKKSHSGHVLSIVCWPG